jgi:hypothetical protein
LIVPIEINEGDKNNSYMGRVALNQLSDKRAYEYYTGIDGGGDPTWSTDISQRQTCFTDVNGVGTITVIYNAEIGRYIATVSHGSVGEFGIFDSPEPWGPWTTVAYYDNWGNYGSSEAFVWSFPTKWISSDGKTMWCVFSSTGELDSFNLVKATLTLKPEYENSPAAPSDLRVIEVK